MTKQKEVLLVKYFYLYFNFWWAEALEILQLLSEVTCSYLTAVKKNNE